MSAASQLTIAVTSRDHLRGAPTAPITLVEYGDYECPHCSATYPVVEAVRGRLASELCFVYRHFPLARIHPHAERAAEAAEAAGAQSKFWAMHERLFEYQDALDDENLVWHATLIGLDMARFAGELKSGEYLPRVRKDFFGGVASGVNGTPTFFINSFRYNGPHDARSLIAAMQDVKVPR
jgi:protein-disulfide isomerase